MKSLAVSIARPASIPKLKRLTMPINVKNVQKEDGAVTLV
jgi:hypothetical protein